MFPFDEPTPTAFYLVLYLGAMMLHVVPMNYVLGGSAYLAVLSAWELFRGRAEGPHAALAATLRNWLPLATSIAITAGVAPLLFLQVLYKEPFYTANLLLFHRWMLILPVLIAAFYLLYVQKLKRVADGPAGLRLLVTICVLSCFAFVAWAWTENHLLSTRGQATWSEQYEHGGFFYGDHELSPRLSLWCVGTLLNLAAVLAWQHRGSKATVRPLARIALGGLIASVLVASWYAFTLGPEVRGAIVGRASLWLGLASSGIILQTAGWGLAWRSDRLTSSLRLMLTGGALIATAGMTVVREVRRLVEIDITRHYATHADAAEVGGQFVFLFFLAANGAAIAWVFALVRNGKQTPKS